MVMNFAFLIEMVLFNRSFTVVMSAVGVLMLPSYYNLSPPTRSRTLSGSNLDGLCVHTIVIYVTFLFSGTFDRGIKKTVLFPLVLPKPCANLPSSLHMPASHFSLYSSCWMRFLYSKDSPVLLSITELTIHWAYSSIGMAVAGFVDSVVWCAVSTLGGWCRSECLYHVWSGNTSWMLSRVPWSTLGRVASLYSLGALVFYLFWIGRGFCGGLEYCCLCWMSGDVMGGVNCTTFSIVFIFCQFFTPFEVCPL